MAVTLKTDCPFRVEAVRKRAQNAASSKIDPSDRAVLSWRQLGKGKATPETK